MNFEKILIVDDEVSGRRLLENYLRSQKFIVYAAGTVSEADCLLKQEFVDLLLVDIGLPDGNGSDLLRKAASMEPAPISLVLSGIGTSESVVQCLRAGAFDYLTKPFTLEALAAAMERASTYRHELLVRRYLENELCCSREMVGDSAGIRHLRSVVGRVATTDSPVLICGEKGTGKCQIAGMLHRASPRANGPLVRVNCAESNEAALENEFFGRITECHEETVERRILSGGKLELAQGGTLLLDEVSELPMCIQLKLLRVLQCGEYARPGCERAIKFNARIVATTQRDLAGCVARGTFSQELHMYLNSSILHVPPLRERISDLPMLVFDWLERLEGGCSGRPSGISDEALRHLMAYSWPGNLKELENVMERVAILGEGGARLEAEAFEWLSTRRTVPRETGDTVVKRITESRFQTEAPVEPLLTLEELEKRQVLRALEVTNQNRTRAAGLLKISVRTLRNKLHQYRSEDPTLALTLARHRNLPVVSSPETTKAMPNVSRL